MDAKPGGRGRLEASARLTPRGGGPTGWGMAEDELETLLERFQEALAEATQHVVLVRGKDGQGEPFWAYVAMTEEAHQRFQAQTGGGDLADYGTILTAGTGPEPPSSVRQRMDERFGPGR